MRTRKSKRASPALPNSKFGKINSKTTKQIANRILANKPLLNEFRVETHRRIAYHLKAERRFMQAKVGRALDMAGVFDKAQRQKIQRGFQHVANQIGYLKSLFPEDRLSPEEAEKFSRNLANNFLEYATPILGEPKAQEVLKCYLQVEHSQKFGIEEWPRDKDGPSRQR